MRIARFIKASIESDPEYAAPGILSAIGLIFAFAFFAVYFGIL